MPTPRNFRAPAHPRSRRENIITGIIGVLSEGSSPLTRGKRWRRGLCFWECGLIPTHAGKTRSSELDLNGGGAHPRSHGENKQLLVAAASQRGSSPLTRGKRDRLRELRLELGLIPTHAGKTRGPGRARTRWGAHPHSRGENVRALAFMVPIVSSSPLMRGKLRVARTGQVVDGLIPAHAGKTGRSTTRPRS